MGNFSENNLLFWITVRQPMKKSIFFDVKMPSVSVCSISWFLRLPIFFFRLSSFVSSASSLCLATNQRKTTAWTVKSGSNGIHMLVFDFIYVHLTGWGINNAPPPFMQIWPIFDRFRQKLWRLCISRNLKYDEYIV